MIAIEERFWSKVDKNGPVPVHAPRLGCCWLWTGKPNPDGYGEFYIHDHYVLAYRFAWMLREGPVPDGKELDHECRTPICVNPVHLRPISKKQNMENRRGATRVSKSGVRGVYWVGGRVQKWRAQVRHYGHLYNVGYFDTIEAADTAAIAKRNELFTHNGEGYG